MNDKSGDDSVLSGSMLSFHFHYTLNWCKPKMGIRDSFPQDSSNENFPFDFTHVYLGNLVLLL